MLLTGWGIRFRSDSIYNGAGLWSPPVEWEKLAETRTAGRGILESVLIDGGPHHRTRAFGWLLRAVPSQDRGEWLAQQIWDERTRRMGLRPS